MSGNLSIHEVPALYTGTIQGSANGVTHYRGLVYRVGFDKPLASTVAKYTSRSGALHMAHKIAAQISVTA